MIVFLKTEILAIEKVTGGDEWCSADYRCTVCVRWVRAWTANSVLSAYCWELGDLLLSDYHVMWLVKHTHKHTHTCHLPRQTDRRRPDDDMQQTDRNTRIESKPLAASYVSNTTKGALQERSVNRAVSQPTVNSDWAVNSVSRCKKLGQLTIWLTVCHAVTDLLT